MDRNVRLKVFSVMLCCCLVLYRYGITRACVGGVGNRTGDAQARTWPTAVVVSKPSLCLFEWQCGVVLRQGRYKQPTEV